MFPVVIQVPVIGQGRVSGRGAKAMQGNGTAAGHGIARAGIGSKQGGAKEPDIVHAEKAIERTITGVGGQRLECIVPRRGDTVLNRGPG